MRIAADTNTVISGLLWHGAPREVLNLSRTGHIVLVTSPVLLAELEDVLQREKFAKRLDIARVTPDDLVMGYAALATVVKPASIDPVLLNDPADDAVLACALAGNARHIVSGDRHLLNLKSYRRISILSAPELLAIWT